MELGYGCYSPTQAQKDKRQRVQEPSQKNEQPKKKKSKDQFFLVPSVHTVRLVVSCVHIMCGDLRFMEFWGP